METILSFEQAGEGLGEIDPRIGEEHADRGEIPGLGRDDHLRDRQLMRQRRRLEVFRVDSAIAYTPSSSLQSL